MVDRIGIYKIIKIWGCVCVQKVFRAVFWLFSKNCCISFNYTMVDRTMFYRNSRAYLLTFTYVLVDRTETYNFPLLIEFIFNNFRSIFCF